jgi:hypothetical protein
MKRTTDLLTSLSLALIFTSAAFAGSGEIKRMADGHPDLSGTFNAATLTPLQRPVSLGDRAFLTLDEARELAEAEVALAANANRKSGDREAPPEGGATVFGFEEDPEGGNQFGAGNVGGYNWFWVDRGHEALSVDGQFPTSILTEPSNGRLPEPSEAAKKKSAEQAAFRRPNDGTAWWLELDGPGPYDHPESLPTSERCLVGFTGVAPTFPSLYNNYKRIIQTEDHVMILVEMIHDARVVRMNSKHPGPEVRRWLGDSIGWWEGDTLVVETTNFHPLATIRGVSENARVVERFTRQPDGNVHYHFRVEDDSMWTQPWGGEYVWKSADERIYEYACHEGNYSMGGTLRGARLLEKEAKRTLESDGR